MSSLRRRVEPVLSWAIAYPGRSIGACVGMAIVIYFATMYHPFGWLTGYSSRAPLKRIGTGHYVNLLAMLGLVITTLGVIYTYFQLKWSYERIENYRSLYNWIEKLIEEIQKKEASLFYFYGSTLLPGSLAFDAPEKITWLKQKLEDICLRHGESESLYGHVTEVRLILPDAHEVATIFGFYEKKQVFGRKELNSDEWLKLVGSEKKKALELQASLVAHAMTDNGKAYLSITEVAGTDLRKIGTFEPAYFFSNGKRIIYVVALHYTGKIADSAGKILVKPTLLGLTTTNAAIIDGFHEHFSGLSA